MWGAKLHARAGGAPGPRHRRQGRHDQARRGLPQSARRAGGLLRRADAGGARARLPLARAPPGARLGEFAIFNRSHYEDVLVVAGAQAGAEEVWKERYDHISDFEALLAEHDTIVLKFFLHITKKEQKERLLEREERAGDGVEAQRRTTGRSASSGTSTPRPTRTRSRKTAEARALERRAGEREVVPQPGRRRIDRGCAAPLSRGMAREAEGHRQGATRGGTRIPQRVGRMAGSAARQSRRSELRAHPHSQYTL